MEPATVKNLTILWIILLVGGGIFLAQVSKPEKLKARDCSKISENHFCGALGSLEEKCMICQSGKCVPNPGRACTDCLKCNATGNCGEPFNAGGSCGDGLVCSEDGGCEKSSDKKIDNDGMIDERLFGDIDRVIIESVE